MKKKQIKHFASEKSVFSRKYRYPACHCYHYKYNGSIRYLVVLEAEGTIIRKEVTCKNCQRTRVFRKLK